MNESETPEWALKDREWAAALYIFDKSCLRDKDCRRYVNFERERIEFSMLQEVAAPWSRGEKILVQLANELFNGDGQVNLAEMIKTLDDYNLEVALYAIRMRAALPLPPEPRPMDAYSLVVDGLLAGLASGRNRSIKAGPLSPQDAQNLADLARGRGFVARIEDAPDGRKRVVVDR